VLLLYCQLTLTVDALPTPINHEQYICEFGSSASSSMATYDANTLRCPAVVPQGAASTGQGHPQLYTYYVTHTTSSTRPTTATTTLYVAVIVVVVIIVSKFHSFTHYFNIITYIFSFIDFV